MSDLLSSDRYRPPELELLEKLAHDACAQIALNETNEAFTRPEVLGGLTAYLKFTADLLTRHLNRGERGIMDPGQSQNERMPE